MHSYSNEEFEFIRDNIKGRTIKDLTEMFNKHFDLNLKTTQIRAFTQNHKLKSGVCARFKKGHTPHNKGKKGVGGWEPTQFKKGHRPANYMPVGSERVNADGYVDVKIEDPSKWRGKHILTWEKVNGPLPKGHVIIFGDGNNRNFDINNLILVSRRQLLTLNSKGLIQKDADLTRVGVTIADLYAKIGKRKKK